MPSPGTTCAGRGTIEIGGDVKLAACILIKDVNSTRIIKISFFMVIKLLRVKMSKEMHKHLTSDILSINLLKAEHYISRIIDLHLPSMSHLRPNTCYSYKTNPINFHHRCIRIGLRFGNSLQYTIPSVRTIVCRSKRKSKAKPSAGAKPQELVEGTSTFVLPLIPTFIPSVVNSTQ